MEFALEVRRRILAERPTVVAVELPATLEEVYLEAIRRLPQISVIFYNDTAYRSDAEAERAVYVPVEPADPFVEAIRSAQEMGAADRVRRSRFERAAALCRTRIPTLTR